MSSATRAVETVESRILLSATTDPAPAEATSAELQTQATSQADETQQQYGAESQSEIDLQVAAFATALATALHEPDYDSAIDASPVGGLYLASPLSAVVEGSVADQQQQLAESQNDAQSAQASGDVLTTSQPGSDSIFGEGTSVASFAAGLLGTGGSGNSVPSSSSPAGGTGPATSPGSGGDAAGGTAAGDGTTTTTGNAGATNPAGGGDSQDDPDPDPRLAWTPHELPEGVAFPGGTFTAQQHLGNPFAIVPNGSESFENVTTTSSPEIVTPTDQELGTGERTENTTSIVTESQEWNSDDDWTVTQTLRQEYSSDEESSDDNDVGTGVNRDSWTELSVTVINGTRTIVSFTSSDSFSYSNSSSYDEGKPDDGAGDGSGSGSGDGAPESANGGDTSGSGNNTGDTTGGGPSDDGPSDNGDDTTGDGTAGGGDSDGGGNSGGDDDGEPLDTDTGSFDASIEASSSFTVTFQQIIVTNADGTQSMIITLSQSTSASYEASIDSSFEAGDSEGELKPVDAPSTDSGKGGDDDGDDSGDNGSGSGSGDSSGGNTNMANPDEGGQPLPEVEPGGNGSAFSVGASVSLSDSVSQNSAVSVGGMIPMQGTVDSLSESDTFGSLGFGHSEQSSGDVSQSLMINVQSSGGDTTDGSDTHANVYLNLDGSAGGSAGLNFDASAEFGEIPEALNNIPGSDDSDIPDPVLGGGAGDGGDGDEDGVGLGFGVNLEDYGNSTRQIVISEKTQTVNGNDIFMSEKTLGTGGSSNSDTSFGFSIDDEGDLTLNISVSSSANHGTVFGSEKHTASEFVSLGDTIISKGWAETFVVDQEDSSHSITVSLDTEGEVTVDIPEPTFTSTKTINEVWTLEFTRKGPGFYEKDISKNWSTKGLTIGVDADGNPVAEVIDIEGSRTESIRAGQSSVNSPDDEDNSTTIMLDAISASLDWAGMLPGVGIVPDLLNAGLNVARGKMGAAGLSLAASIPLLGQGVMAAKLGAKGAKGLG